MTKASALGHDGIGYPATITSGRITNLASCAMAIRPNTTHATRNPLTCEFIFASPLDLGPLMSPRNGIKVKSQ